MHNALGCILSLSLSEFHYMEILLHEILYLVSPILLDLLNTNCKLHV